VPRMHLNGFEMYYEVIGNGPPVVCATGWGTGTGHKVAMYPPRLADEFQLIVYDHRGIGRSRGGLDREPSTELYAEDLAALMNGLGLEKAHVFGRGGLGGCIAQRLAIQFPDLVASAIFAQSWVYADALLAGQFATLAQLRRRSFEEFQLACSWLCHLPAYFAEHREELVSPTGPWSDIREAPEAHLALMEASGRHDAREDLASVSCASLVLHTGPRDWITGERLGDALLERLPQAQSVYLEFAPHAAATHAPSWRLYQEAVHSFLKEQPTLKGQ
jgi:pimeloyl-ACP methyl ester carboxylesterase